MLLNAPGRFPVMSCALLVVLDAAGCSSGVGGGSGGATASGGGAAGHSSVGSTGSGVNRGASGGGAAGIGGLGGGTTGAGGATDSCQRTETQCSANGLQTCSTGQWGAAVACTGAVGAAKCPCNTEPVCGAVGSVCDTPSKLAACSQDAQGCLYEASSPCTNGAYGGAAGLAACCRNACTTVGTQCGSSTSLQTCSVAGNGCTTLVTSTCSTGLLCERIAPADCVDPTWAEWPMPNGPVDVAAGAPNPEAYTDNGDGTITDNVTKLMWQKVVPTETYTIWAQAAAYCPTLTLGGHSDWRLPSRIELVSIVDVGRSDPSINGTYFPATPASYFWSSSLAGRFPPLAWYVNFDFGYSNYYGGEVDGDVVVFHVPVHVRCVR